MAPCPLRAAGGKDRVDVTKIIARSVWRKGMQTSEDLLTGLGGPTE